MGLIRGLLGEVGVPTTGLIGQIGNGLSSHSNMLLGLASGGGQGAIQGARMDALNALQQREQEDKQKKIAASMEWAKTHKVDPNFAAAYPDQIAQIAAKQWMPKDYSVTDQYLLELKKNDPAKFAQLMEMKAGGGNEFGLNPIYGTDENGNTVLGQLGKNGQFRPVQMSNGFRISTGVEKVDLGTRWGLVDRRSGQIVGYEPKDLAGAERDKAVGQAQGQAEAAAPNQIAAGQVALDTLDQIENNPARESATGWQSNFPTVKGSKVADFENLVEQAKSGAFLTAIQQMRGLGQLTEKEGSAATAAINRMNIATSDAGFLKALQDYRAIVQNGLNRARRIQGGGSVTTPPPAAARGRTSSGIGWSAQ